MNEPMFSRKVDTQQAYEKRIDELFAGAKPRDVRRRENAAVVLDRADILGLLKITDGPVYLDETAVGKPEKGQPRGTPPKHPNMTADVWKKIPQWLDNPIAVFDSATVEGDLVLLAPELVDGSVVLMSVDPKTQGADRGVTISLLTNAYDKDGGVPPVNQWLREGKAWYIDAKKFPDVMRRGGLQSPATAQNKPGMRRILTEKNLSGWRKANEPMFSRSAPASFRAQEVRNEQGQLLAPNGEASKLNEGQWHQVRSPEFKKWFGDWENDPNNASKVVDANGEPMVVYHGTPDSGFNVFRKESYFTANIEYADIYRSTSDPRRSGTPDIYQVFLSIRNPFDTRVQKNRAIFNNEYYQKRGTGSPLTDIGLPDWTEGRDLIEFFEETKKDFDGLILNEGGNRGISYVPINPNQIKSATGNSGAFDGGNPDIRFSRKVDTKQAYEKRIDELFAGGKANRQGARVLDRSDVLELLGYNNFPVVLKEGKVITGQEKHPNMTAEHWKKVPTWMDDPTAVFDSDTVRGAKVFIAPELVKDSVVMITVEPDATLSATLAAHSLTNAYDKDNGPPPFMRWLRMGLTNYIDTKKFPNVVSRAGLQLPRKETQNKPGMPEILTEKNLAGWRKANEPMFSRKVDAQQSYENRIDELFSGAQPQRGGIRVLDRADILDLIGYGSKPMDLLESKVIKSQDDHPNMKADHWKKIPEWLDNPAAVFDSDTVPGRLVFVAPELVAGAPVLMAVTPDSQNTGTLEVSLLVSAYDAQGGRTPFGRWVRDGMMRYANTKEFPAVLKQSVGLQLPESAFKNKPGMHKILTEKNLAGWRNANKPMFSRKDPEQDMYLGHNISPEGLRHALKLGGLAAPSLAVTRTTTGGLENFGSITLLANKDMIGQKDSPLFNADVYSPRQPRAIEKTNHKAWAAFERELHGLPPTSHVPDVYSFTKEGAYALSSNAMVQQLFFKQRGTEIKAVKKKLNTFEAKAVAMAKKNGWTGRWSMEESDAFKQLAQAYADDSVRKITEADPKRAERFKDGFVDENGAIQQSFVRDFAWSVSGYLQTDGIDISATNDILREKLRRPAVSIQFNRWIESQVEKLSDGKLLDTGRRPKPYTLENVVAEMTRKIRGGENFNYGAGNIRAQYADQIKTVKDAQGRRESIISGKEFETLKEESNTRLLNTLEELKPYYRFDATGFAYFDDASQALAEGPRGIREAFDLDAKGHKIVDDLIGYLRSMPTSYFEMKVQRAMQLSEFAGAVVPNGTDADLIDRLKADGLRVVKYNPKEEGSRMKAIERFDGLMFSRKQSAETFEQSKEQFARLVDRFVQGNVDASATHEILPKSTDSMRMLGLPDLPVRIGSHALDALYNHGVTPTQMKRLIDELDSPRMVMIWNRGRGGEMSLNFVTSMNNAKGEPFVIGMKPNRGTVEGRNHWVATVTEKQPRAILDMVRDGGALYVGDGEIAGISGKELREALRFAKEKRGRESRELKAVMASSHKLSYLVERVLYTKDLEQFKGKDVAFSHKDQSTWDMPEPSMLDEFIYQIQDRQINLKRVQEAIGKVKQVSESVDAYLKEELYHGRVAARAHKFLDVEVRPLLMDMKFKNVSMEELEAFLLARNSTMRASAHA